MNSQLDMVSKYYDTSDLKITIVSIMNGKFNVEFYFKNTDTKVTNRMNCQQLATKLSNIIIIYGIRNIPIDISKERVCFVSFDDDYIQQVNKCMLLPNIPERFYTHFLTTKKTLELTCN